MFTASFSRTMSNAKQIVPDAGICLRPPRQRQAVASLSQRWNLAKEAKERAEAEKRARQLVQYEAYAAAGTNYRAPTAVEIVPATSPKVLIEMVACWHGVGYCDIIGKSRLRTIIPARFDAIAAVYMNCRVKGQRLSLNQVGRAFKKRDHTTIHHALRKRGLA